MIPKFKLTPFEFVARDTRLRFPFRYGIASMVEVPHQFVRTTVWRDGQPSIGFASEGLPPKWFTKNPETEFAADLVDMRRVIHRAADLAVSIARQPITFYEW